MKRYSALLLALLLAAQTISCGDSGKNQTETTENSGETTAKADGYEFSEKWSGRELTILNPYDIYSMHSELDRETQTGEPLDDAMYDRCRKLEEKMGIKIVEDNTPKIDKEVNELALKTIMAGEDQYDIMYVSTNGIYSLSEQEALTDLKTLSGLNLDQSWWQTNYNKLCEMKGSLYAAVSPAHLMYIDSLWCLFFNEDKITDLKLEMPYDLVRDGKWTLDTLLTYQKAAADLKGDESFEWNESGSSVYGLSGRMVTKLLAGAGEPILDKDKNGDLLFTAGTERFYSACEKIAKNVSKNDGINFNNYTGGLKDGDPGHYITMFEVERALFVNAEICKTSRMRNKDFGYGIVPMPKLDESQESYYASPFDGCPMLTIPKTAKDKAFSAAAADALSYISASDVLPVYKEITLESKGLRNDDSIEMLGIILDGITPDLSYLYTGIIKDFSNQLQTAITEASGSYASVVAANKDAINKKLEPINN